MAEQERNKQNQDQEVRHNLFVSPKEEVHSKIDIERGQDVEPPVDTETNQEASTPRHPDVKAEKKASKAARKPRTTVDERTDPNINPKTNVHNQYR